MSITGILPVVLGTDDKKADVAEHPGVVHYVGLLISQRCIVLLKSGVTQAEDATWFIPPIICTRKPVLHVRLDGEDPVADPA
ncbi:hypothetical protein [Anatilimnocola aggregata]|uniref:hypothetical protein n=1 Tax=Anatilimnocola aggregata TaxID=2528021 RepID=UPI0011A4E794|nr:hypothetical protein [Anatilimnocola aggregata]